MPIRNPIYLDQDLLQNIADYLGIGYPVETKVRERGTRERSGSGGVGVPGTGLRGDLGRSSSDEVETTYEAPVRPVKVFNDVLDAALGAGDVKRFDGTGVVSVGRRDLIEIEGFASLASVSEVGELLEKVLPAFASTVGAGRDEGIPEGLIAAVLSDEAAPRPLLFDLVSEDVQDLRVFLQIDQGWFHRNATPDDINGEVTVFASVDQLIPEGGEVGLERFLMPGANRAARRMMGKENLADLMARLGHKDEPLHLEGPAWVLRPIAVF